MARVKGRDLVLEIVEAVERAERTAQQQTELMEAVTALSEHTTERIGQLRESIAQLNERVASLESESDELSLQFAKGARLAQEHARQLGQVGRLLRELAGGSETRFDTIETRLDALERKVG